jgi:hypothetical protein
MKAIFAPGHLQSDLHIGSTSGHRLARFLKLLGECGVEFSFPSLETLSAELDDANLIIATTRSSDFPKSELEVLANAVASGRSLLHLSNHKPFPLYDSQFSQRLGYSFNNQKFVDRSREAPFEVEVDLEGLPGYSQGSGRIRKVSINNCSSIVVNNDRFNTIAVLPEGCINPEDDGDGRGELFAVACEASEYSGRIVAMADSGLIGEPFGRYRGPGLNVGENYEIVSEIIKWLVS